MSVTHVIRQGFTIDADNNLVCYTGFSNDKAILTIEGKRGFEEVPIDVAEALFNERNTCPLDRPDVRLNRRHGRHIKKFLKGLTHE